jgi:hypothetical protein
MGFLLTLSGTTNQDITVFYNTSDISATSGSDYTGITSSHTFFAGETSSGISIPIANDSVYEGNETFALNLTSATGGAVIAPTSVTGTIIESTPPPQFAITSAQFNENVGVANVTITAHATPGHTPGGTTWSWESCEDSRCLEVVYADSISAVAAPGFRFTGDASRPSIVEAFRRSIDTVGRLRCDIMIGAHPFVGDLDGKWKQRSEHPDGPNPFIDPGACRALAAEARKRSTKACMWARAACCFSNVFCCNPSFAARSRSKVS